MKWERLTLGELCQKYNGKIQTGPFGSQLHQSDYKEHGTPVVMPKDIVNDKISIEGIARIDDKDTERLSKHILKIGDIVFPRRGEINKRALIRKENEGFLCGTGCLKISINSEQVSNLFLNYFLAKKESVDWLDNNAVGSTMKNISGEILGKVPIDLPPLPTQQKIASILSAYDDLIENNLKRIKLLEEAAQHLYREWFVRFRFPGHETVQMVEGLPEGWERKTIKDFGEVITGKTPSTENRSFFGGQIPFVKTPDMHGNIFTISTDIGLTEEGASSQKNKYLPPLSVMVSCIGTAGVVSLTADFCQTNQQINSIVSDKDFKSFYVYFFSKDLKGLLEGLGSNGATFVNVNKSKFETIGIVIPNEGLLIEFGRIVKPFFTQILTLQKQNHRLKTARDLLLPRLMSGVLEV